MQPLAALTRWITAATADARPLGVVRICAGLVAATLSFEVWGVLLRLTLPSVLHLPYWSFTPALPTAAVGPWMMAWLMLALTFALGLATRWTGRLLTALMTITLLLDQQLYSHHLYLATLIIFLLTLADSGAAWSLDARRYGPRATVPAWPVLLLKLQLSLLYGFSAVAKLTAPYLSGAVLGQYLDSNVLALLPGAWPRPALLVALAYGSIITEAFLAVVLWLPRWRVAGAVVGVGLHLMLIVAVIPPTVLSKIQLTEFAVICIACYLLFWPWPLLGRRRVVELPH